MARADGLALPCALIENPPQIIMEPFDQRQNFERFGEWVLADPELHDRLRAAVDVEAFVTLAVRLGAERDCVFSALVVETALREQRRAWLERWV